MVLTVIYYGLIGIVVDILMTVTHDILLILRLAVGEVNFGNQFSLFSNKWIIGKAFKMQNNTQRLLWGAILLLLFDVFLQCTLFSFVILGITFYMMFCFHFGVHEYKGLYDTFMFNYLKKWFGCTYWLLSYLVDKQKLCKWIMEVSTEFCTVSEYLIRMQLLCLKTSSFLDAVPMICFFDLYNPNNVLSFLLF